ncbi:DegV family protein [Clostridium gasigenes]|uniref:DegV family protein n=1 Tax=Clostridium gasigenes TaxID=94869 RepID=UPI0014386659|nr:DegV family protein [Clostridium gasigenes]NKF08422.1 DegV family protein [Clostridium gasigenes]QSW18613.1 DegV family protein [Clostridium gasigenes]
MKVVIMTDSCCDLPISFVRENKIEVMPLIVNIKGEDIPDDLGETLENKEFYNALRGGELTSTACANTFEYIKSFKKHVEKGDAVIYIGFSSRLSGCINSASVARETVLEEYKDADITVIDSKSASLGLGLIVHYGCNLLNRGYTKEKIVEWIEENKLKVNHWFTVDDLNHLKRGGRVSQTAATVGTVLHIKPIMNVNNDGKLIPISKVKGRKKSIRTLAEIVKERIIESEKQVIFISHGDCIEEAEHLKNLLLEENKVKDIIINPVGPVIGSHSGPGTLAVFFIGEER